MEQFLQFIFILALAKYCINAALTRRIFVEAIYATVLAVVGFAVWPLVVNWRGDMIADLLSNSPLVADSALLITLEAVAGIFISVFLLDNYFMPKEKRRKSIFVLKVLPGVICFFAVAYFELLFFRSCVGMDFDKVALLYTAIVFAVVFGLSFLLGWLMPGESTKLEAKIVLDMAILFMGLFVNASIASYNISSSHTEVLWTPMLALIAMMVVLAVLGFIVYNVSPKIKNKLCKENKK